MKDKVKILKSNSAYRVADLIHYKDPNWKIWTNQILHDPQYEDTILRDYFNKKRKDPDIQTLKDIIWEHIDRKNYPTASDSELVVHVRLGDRLDEKTLIYNENSIYKRSLEFYDTFLENIPQEIEISKVTVVTALHFGDFKFINKFHHTQVAEDRSFEVLDLIKQRVEEKELEFGIVSNDDVDRDLAYMASSKYFIQSFSEMSFLASQCLREDAVIIPAKIIRNEWEGPCESIGNVLKGNGTAKDYQEAMRKITPREWRKSTA